MFPQQKEQLYRFDGFTIDAAKRVLRRDGEPVPLSPKAFDLLVVLVENRGRIMTKEQLLHEVWPDQFVEEGNLTVHMSAVRKALGDGKAGSRFVVTIPGRGYKFVSDLSEGSEGLVIEQHTLSRVVVEHEESEILEGTTPTPAARFMMNPAPLSAALPRVEAARSAKPWQSVAGVVRARSGLVALGVMAVLALAAAGWYWYRTQSARQQAGDSSRGGSKEPSRQKVTRVTSNGKVQAAAISPDGQYVAYIASDANGMQSIHLTEAGTSSDVRVLAPQQSSLSAISFTPDGENLCFYRQRKEGAGYYKMSVLGGAPERILPGMDGPIAVSPDGRRVAFHRAYPERKQDVLLVANADDGSDEQELASVPYPRAFYSAGLAWSPDGKVIAISAFPDSRQQFNSLVTVQVADGTITPLSSRLWGDIENLAWLPDGSGLVMVAGDDEMLDFTQVWLVSYPGGQDRRITNDILRYGPEISLSSSSNELVVGATELATNIWVSPFAEPSQAKQITFGAGGRFDGLYGLGFTPDGRIAYGAYVGYQQTIWIMNEDGSDQKQLTPGRRHISDSAVRMSPDGRYIVFHTNRSGSSEIWRIDVDGGNPTQITAGGTKYQPAVSADSKWVVYRSWEDGGGHLWRVPLEGGTPARLTDRPGAWPGFSPDGRLIAYTSGGKLFVIPADGGAPLLTFNMPPTGSLYAQGAIWTPDGSALLYRDTIQGIWRQPLAGGDPQKIPGLRSETVFDFAISPDGQKMAITYGTQRSDAVLIRDFR